MDASGRPVALVVDRDPEVRATLQVSLELRGWSASTAETLAEGVALAGSQHPDLVVVDGDLPDGSGWELAEHLREDAQPACILLFSAATDQTTGEEARRLHVYPMSKVDQQSLFRAIDKLHAELTLLEV